MKTYPKQRCPFCGGEPCITLIERTRNVHRGGRIVRQERIYRVKCSRCHTAGPRKLSERVAVRAWDRRPAYALRK